MNNDRALFGFQTLRRYTFCLLSSGVLGDIAIKRALQKLAGDCSSWEVAAVSRIDIYKSINESVSTWLLDGKVSAVASGGLLAKFARLTLLERQIAALHDVAGFAHRDIASIMAMEERDVRRRYVQSLRALRDEPPTVLIIEDEAIIALELREILTGLGFSVAGMARNRAEALNIAGRFKPKLILADYKLRNDTGVDVIKAIREHINAEVIYVTSHPDATKASLETPRDIVIPKPLDPQAIERAVQMHLAA